MDVSFSPAEIALIIALLGAVTTPLGYIFRLLLKEKDRQIERLEKQLDDGRTTAFKRLFDSFDQLKYSHFSIYTLYLEGITIK